MPWKGIEGLKDENAFRAWIFRILANKCRQKLKSYLNRAVELPADLAWRERDTSEDMDVRAAFYKLNDEERLMTFFQSVWRIYRKRDCLHAGNE